MKSGIINIVIGLAGVGLGLSGKALIFTNSSTALVAVGGAIALWGVVQIVRDRARLNK